MSYWHELERECKELREQVASLTEENDIQRQAIQNLSAQVVTLRDCLARLVPAEGHIQKDMLDNEAVNLVTTVGTLRQLTQALASLEGGGK